MMTTLSMFILRHLIHKSSYLQGHIKKATVKKWLQFLINTPLYKLYNLNIDDSFFNSHEKKNIGAIEILCKGEDYDEKLLKAQQQTLLWSEEKYLSLAPLVKIRVHIT